MTYRPERSEGPAFRLCLLGCVLFAASAQAQQPMGSVPTADAKLSGALEVHEGRATLLSNASITAYDHAAHIALARGGEALVCQTSQFHLLHSGSGEGLLFGLDRGAVELRSSTKSGDIVLTPDIRFSIENPGQMDLRLRVTRDGDTCVDNAGAHAPVLMLNASFSGATYRVLPGQHILFEHGDLHQVVDHERSTCGCPEAQPTPQQLAANATEAQKAAAAHPFPEAESQGLTTQPDALPPRTGQGTDVVLTAVPLAQSDQQPKQHHGFFGAIGAFFHKLFG